MLIALSHLHNRTHACIHRHTHKHRHKHTYTCTPTHSAPVYISIYLPTYLSIYLSIYLYVYLSLSLYIYIVICVQLLNTQRFHHAVKFSLPPIQHSSHPAILASQKASTLFRPSKQPTAKLLSFLSDLTHALLANNPQLISSIWHQ